MPYSQIEIQEYSRRIGKSAPTLWRWVRQGCDLRDPKSVREWVTRNTIRETNIEKARKRRRDQQQKGLAPMPERHKGLVPIPEGLKPRSDRTAPPGQW
jgi:hypothetical protein